MQDRDKTSLKKWLQSTNSERQVYAVEGFYLLKQKGITLTEEAFEMINAIKKKKGTITTCYPCDRRQKEISLVTNSFKFNN